MNKFKIGAIVIALMTFLFSTSCVVYRTENNGKHRGWYKNPKNPHNPNSSKPFKGKGKQK